MKTLNAFSPLDGTLLKEYPIASIGEMEAALLRAKETFRIFSETDTGKRIRLLKSLRSVIIAETDNIVATICKTTGKVKSEALMTEVFPVLATLKYYEKHLKKFLKPRKVPVPFAFMGIKAGVSLRPSGIALIISPWNFPFQLAMIPIISAIAAGNSVLLKPSEYALPVGELIANLCQSAGFPSFLIQTIYGDGNYRRRVNSPPSGQDFIYRQHQSRQKNYATSRRTYHSGFTGTWGQISDDCFCRC